MLYYIHLQIDKEICEKHWCFYPSTGTCRTSGAAFSGTPCDKGDPNKVNTPVNTTIIMGSKYSGSVDRLIYLDLVLTICDAQCYRFDADASCSK